jgi:hypothetical protein
MSVAVRGWLRSARVRERLKPKPAPSWQDLVARYAPGRSFVDLGCMWGVNGGMAFSAEEQGASPVTGVDFVAATQEFLDEHRRRSSKLRFVQGDINDEDTLREVGTHDVVFCSGVLYHVPNPVLTLERLRSITREVLLLRTASLPEIPGMPNACIYYPGLSPRDRAPYDAPAANRGHARHGISNAFDPSRDRGYGNWWWGLTPSALRGMLLTAGFADVELHQDVTLDSFALWAIAQPGVPRFD